MPAHLEKQVYWHPFLSVPVPIYSALQQYPSQHQYHHVPLQVPLQPKIIHILINVYFQNIKTITFYYHKWHGLRNYVCL